MRTASLAIIRSLRCQDGTHKSRGMLCRSTQYDITISYRLPRRNSGLRAGMSHAPDVAFRVRIHHEPSIGHSSLKQVQLLPLGASVVSIERFLKQRAVDIVMEGTYVLSNWYDPQGRLRTFDCRATRVSPFRMMVDMPVVGKVGDNLTSYFRDIGNFEGTISDTARSGRPA